MMMFQWMWTILEDKMMKWVIGDKVRVNYGDDKTDKQDSNSLGVFRGLQTEPELSRNGMDWNIPISTGRRVI